MQIIWKIIKAILATFLTLVFILVVYIQYTESSIQKRMSQSSTVQMINKMEREGNQDKIWQFLLKKLNSINEEEEGLVIKWLSKRLSDGNGPYYYIISLYYMKDAQRENSKSIAKKALKYFSAGQLVYRTDAMRCNDPTSAQAVPIIESSLFGASIKELLKNNSNLRLSILPWALNQEEKTKDRKLSVWICAHGIRKWTEKVELLPDEKWNEEREKMRRQFANAMSNI